MKLVYCPSCEDVVRLWSRTRRCRCGASGGRYVDDVYAVYWGKAVPIGFDNWSLGLALGTRRETDEDGGTPFQAFVIPEKCRTLIKVDKPVKVVKSGTRK